MSAIGTPSGGILRGLPAVRSPAVRLLIAAGLASAVWAAAQMGLERLLPIDHAAYLLAALAVLVSASVAGMGAGILTTVLLAPAAFLTWEDPDTASSRDQRWQDAAQMTLFILIGGAISVLAGREAAAKRAARENGERFRRILEQGPLGIAIVGRDNRVQAANPMFCQMLGLAPDEIVGRAVGSLTYPPDVAESGALLHRLWRGELPTGYTMVKRYVRKDGGSFWATLSVAVIRDERGFPAYAVGMIQDISDRKRMEEDLQRSREQAELARVEAEAARERAEAASRAKDQFIAVLSHELRTPLSPVLLTASSLEADLTLPGPVREGIHTIRQNVELEARLIDDLLDVTGIARGKLTLRRSRCDAHALLGQALYMIEQDVAGKRLHTRVELGAPCADVDADPTRLQQVFWNLLKNAVKFTPDGGEVTVRTWCEPGGPEAPGAEWLVVEVRDTGPGIEPDVLPRLFKPFEQGPARLARQFGGLGLGLAISRSIVELHGGRIEAASPGPGHGATFTVRLPRPTVGTAMPRPKAPAGATDGQLHQPLPRPAGKLRILLVEDHPATRRAMAAILTSLGHQVRMAGTLAEALGLAEQEGAAFDLLVSDLALPDGSGHDLMRQLKERRRDLHGVAVSGFGMADDVRRSREAGFDEHLTKPVSRERIQEVLAHVGQP